MVPLRETIRRVGVLLALALALFSPVFAGAQHQYHWATMASVACLFGVSALLLEVLSRGRPFRFDAPLLLLLLLAGFFALQLVPLPPWLLRTISSERLNLAKEIAGATGSDLPGRIPATVCAKCTRDALLLLASYVLAFYGASKLLREAAHWKLFGGAFMIGAAILALYGVYDVLFLKQGMPRLTSTYTNPDRFAGLMEIACGVAVGTYLLSRFTSKKPALDRPPVRVLLCLAAAGLFGVSLAMTHSRMGIASMLLVAVLAALVFSGSRRGTWIALTAILAVVAASALLASSPVYARYSVLFDPERQSLGRLQCWRMSLPLAWDFFFAGSGAGTFKHVFALYQEPSLTGWYKYAHNDYLNFLCDGGVLSLALAGAATGYLLKEFLSLRGSSDGEDRAIATTGFLVVVPILFHELADFNMQQPANALLVFMVAGAVHGRARQHLAESVLEGAEEGGGEKRATRLPSRWLRPVLAAATSLLVLLVAVPQLWKLRAVGGAVRKAETLSEEMETASTAADERKARAVKLLERASGIDRLDDEVRLDAARMLVKRAAITRNVLAAEKDAARAEKLISEATTLCPLDPRCYYLLGILKTRRGSFDSADKVMELSARLAPAWPDVAFQVGRYFLFRWHMGGRSDDELLKKVRTALSLAARSPRAIRLDTVRLVVSYGVSNRQTDRLLNPDEETQRLLARELVRAERHEEACKWFDSVLSGQDARERRDPGDHIAYARSLLALERADEAVRQFALALDAVEPEHKAEVLRGLAGLPLTESVAPAVVAYWKSLWQESDQSVGVLRALALAELAAGARASAFEHMHRYATVTDDADAFVRLARMAVADGDLPLAARMADGAARQEPGDLRVQLLRGNILMRLGSNMEAEHAFRECLRISPRHIGAAGKLANLLLAQKRFADAMSVWRKFLHAGGDAATAHERLSDIYLLLYDRPAALEELLRAMDAAGDDERLKRKLENLRSKERK